MAKHPYGIKVRVRGDDNSGYRIQYTYNNFRFLPFLTMWFDYEPYINGSRTTVFSHIDNAKKWALSWYDRMIEQAKEEIDRKKKRKNAKKVVWEHP